VIEGATGALVRQRRVRGEVRLWRSHSWRRPTMPIEALIVCAWAATAALLLGEAAAASRSGHSLLWWCSLNAMPAMNMQAPSGAVPSAVAAGIPMWGLMTCAMMLPVTLPAVRHVAASSPHSRHRRTVAGFLGVYLSMWLLFGALALALVALLGHRSHTAAMFAALSVAAIWQMTRSKQRALNASQRSSTSPSGDRRAGTGALALGLRSGGACIGSCWAIMLVMALAPSERLLWALALTALVSMERLMSRPRLATHGGAVLLGAGALVTALIA
jgi:predicted metal-binding membrane protein